MRQTAFVWQPKSVGSRFVGKHRKNPNFKENANPMQLDFAAFLIVFSFATFVTVTTHGCCRDKRRWSAIVLTLITTSLSCLAASFSVPGRNPVVQLGLLLLKGDRTSLALVAAAGFAGVVAGIGICCWQKTRRHAICVLLLYHGAILGLSLLVLKDAINPYLADSSGSGYTSWIESDVIDGYTIEKIVDLSIRPTGRHHPDHRKWKRVCFNRIARRSSDRLIGVGDAVRHALIAKEGFPEKQVGVIYNGIPLAPILEAPIDHEGVRREFDIPQNGKIIIQVARLDYRKDHITAVRAISELTSRLPSAYWLVVGDGPERAAIEHEIQSLGCRPNVRLTGERCDVPRLLLASNVMLLSSISEGIPLTLIEGMLAELPIVSTSVGRVPEVVHDGQHGCLVPARKPRPMSEQLERVLTTPDLAVQLGQAARQRAIEMFDEEKMHRTYRALYEGMLERCM
jgi:glycosyltransferase involved in cell wall biosynthesis